MPCPHQLINRYLIALFYRLPRRLSFLFGLSIYLLLLGLLSRVSFGQALNYYFWRDDWALVWSGLYNQEIYYNFFLPPLHVELVAAAVNVFQTLVLHTNSYLWQLFGLFLKFINSLLLASLLLQITRNRTTAALGGILAAAYFGGLEAYSWVRLTGVAIALGLTSVIYFYRFLNRGHRSSLVMSYLFFTMSVSAYPGRAIGLLGIFILLLLFRLLDHFSWRNLTRYLLVLLLFLFVPFLLSQLISFLMAVFDFGTRSAGLSSTGFSGSLFLYISRIISQPALFTYFFGNLGNLIKTPFQFLPENDSLSYINSLGIFLGFTYAATLILAIYYYLRTRSSSLSPWIIVLAWAPLLYLPNWIREPALPLGVTHRYLAFSAVGIIMLWSLILGQLRRPLNYLGASLLVSSFLIYAQWVTSHNYLFRSRDQNLTFYQQVAQAVPIGREAATLIFSGDSTLRGFLIDWAGSLPYAYFRGLQSPLEFPVISTPQLSARLICDPQTLVPDFYSSHSRPFARQITLQQIYGWYIHPDGHLASRTTADRLLVASQAECLRQPRSSDLTSGLTLSSIVNTGYLDPQETQSGVLLFWSSSASTPHWLHVRLFDRKNRMISTSTAAVGVGDTTTPVLFTLSPGMDLAGGSLLISAFGSDSSSRETLILLD